MFLSLDCITSIPLKNSGVIAEIICFSVSETKSSGLMLIERLIFVIRLSFFGKILFFSVSENLESSKNHFSFWNKKVYSLSLPASLVCGKIKSSKVEITSAVVLWFETSYTFFSMRSGFVFGNSFCASRISYVAFGKYF